MSEIDEDSLLRTLGIDKADAVTQDKVLAQVDEAIQSWIWNKLSEALSEADLDHLQTHGAREPLRFATIT